MFTRLLLSAAATAPIKHYAHRFATESVQNKILDYKLPRLVWRRNHKSWYFPDIIDIVNKDTVKEVKKIKADYDPLDLNLLVLFWVCRSSNCVNEKVDKNIARQSQSFDISNKVPKAIINDNKEDDDKEDKDEEDYHKEQVYDGVGVGDNNDGRLNLPPLEVLHSTPHEFSAWINKNVYQA